MDKRFTPIQTDKQWQLYEIENTAIYNLITGVGMVNTAYHLSEFLHQHKVDIVINAGIAGSFDNNIAIGDTVMIEYDCFSDLGVEDNDRFLTAHEANLIGNNEFPFTNGWLSAKLPDDTFYNKYKKVKCITVNTVHGNAHSIERVTEKYNPQIETMESAAVLWISKMKALPCILLRTISNKVEPRNKENWQLIRSIKNLNEALDEILIHICTNKF